MYKTQRHAIQQCNEYLVPCFEKKIQSIILNRRSTIVSEHHVDVYMYREIIKNNKRVCTVQVETWT